MTIASGEQIPIETRDPDEIRMLGGRHVTLPDIPVFNPAFDLTPGHLITAIITEKGVIARPGLGTVKELVCREDNDL
jgi:methylthioribose-1-phosphate isomerase